MSLVATHTFEEGTDGAAVASGSNGVVSISNSTYSAAAAIHGSMGVSIAPSGAVGYAAPAATFQASMYGSVVTFGSSNSTIASIRATSSHQGRVRINATGHFELANASNTVLATSTSAVAAGDLYRVDVRCDNSAGTSSTVTVQLYLRGNIEGSTPDEVLGPQTFSTSAINRFYTGTTTTPTWVHTLDTVRLYDDITTWPAAFNAGVAVAGTLAATASLSATVGTASPAVTGSLTATAALSATVASVTPGSTTYTMVGGARSTAALVTAKTSGATSVQIGWSTSSSMTSPTFTTTAAPDGNGEYRVDVTGLTADTLYYYQVFDTPSGGSRTSISSTRTFRTRTSSSAGSSLKVALGSCCLTATTQDDSAFADMAGWDPHYFLHLGDAYYNGNASNTLASQHRTLWEAQIAAVPEWKAALEQVAVEYVNSDHELNPDDTDTNTTNASSFNAFFKATIPARLVDTASPPAGKYRSWVDYVSGVGIRFILLDIRNTDRSPGANTDNSSKTMLGATQKAWLKNELIDSDGTTTALKVIISDVPWNGVASLSNGIDKWWSYDTERTEIGNYITAHGVAVDFLHGDSHRIAVDRTHNLWGGFPVICGSPWSQNGGGNEIAGQMDAEFHNSGTPTSAYMRLTYDVPTAGVIRRTASGWDAMTATERVSQVMEWSTVSGALTATATFSATVSGTHSVSGTLSGSATLSATVVPVVASSGILGATAAFSATVVPRFVVSGSLTASASLTAATQVPVAGSLAATAAVSALVGTSGSVSGTLAATVSLSASVVPVIPVTASLASTGTFSAVTVAQIARAGSLAATAALAATVSSSGGTPAVAGTLTGTGALSAAVTPVASVTGTLAATATPAAAVVAVQPRTGALAATIILTAVSSVAGALEPAGPEFTRAAQVVEHSRAAATISRTQEVT